MYKLIDSLIISSIVNPQISKKMKIKNYCTALIMVFDTYLQTVGYRFSVLRHLFIDCWLPVLCFSTPIYRLLVTGSLFFDTYLQTVGYRFSVLRYLFIDCWLPVLCSSIPIYRLLVTGSLFFDTYLQTVGYWFSVLRQLFIDCGLPVLCFCFVRTTLDVGCMFTKQFM